MKYKQLKTVLVLCLCFMSVMQGRSQGKYYLQLHPVDSPASGSMPPLEHLFDNKQAVLQYTVKLPQLLVSQGYISSSVDSVWESGDTVHGKLFLGERYILEKLSVPSKDLPLLQQLGLQPKKNEGNYFIPSDLQNIYDKLLDYFGRTGYPFARIGIDSMQLKGNRFSGVLHIERGGYYTIDSLNLAGTAKLTPNFLHHYLNIGPHEPYNTDKLSAVDEKLRNLVYVRQTQPWKITMGNTGAMLNLYLNPQQVNQVDAIVGFLPANGSLGGKMLLTGQVNLNLKNAFGAGEAIGFNWQQLQARSPRLNLAFSRPYLFHSPYGVDMDFELYKMDSLYLNVFANLGVSYSLAANQTGTLFVHFASTRLLTVDTATVIASHKLPDIMDVSSINIGMQYTFNNTDYRLNPRRGNEVSLMLMAGNRKVSKNNTILNISDNTFDYNSLYDTVKLKGYQVKIQASGSHYFPIGRQAVLKTALNGGLYQSPSPYVNDLFQIGGYRLLRGFDEESIYTNLYTVATAEYRYLIGEKAYFFVFTDGGYARYKANGLQFSHNYLGVGGGMSFQTKAGILNISYAVGKRDDTKMDMQKAKIHIGFTTVF